jgi:ATP-dependent Clp protease ATP-binding subunit ClpB
MQRIEKLAAARGLKLELSSDARSWLAAQGYDPVYGARPLKRVIQRYVQDELAEKILAGHLIDGAHVIITAGADMLVFESAGTARNLH